MIKQGNNRSIISTESISGHGSNLTQPQIAYHSSKGVVLNMSRAFATEWARYNIRVNTISPGYMDTALNQGDGMTEYRRIWSSRTRMACLGTQGELNGASSFITGSDITIDVGIPAII